MSKTTTVVDNDPTAVEGLVPLAELAAEGLGWGGQYVRTPRDAIDALARELAEFVALDDLGRRCVPWNVARVRLAEQADRERRIAEQRQRTKHVRPRVRGGIPAKPGEENAAPLAKLAAQELQAAEDERMAAYLSGRETGGRYSPPVVRRPR